MKAISSCVLLWVLLFSIPSPDLRAQGSKDWEIYTNDDVFQLLSAPAQMRLERLFGKKARVDIPLQQRGEDKSAAAIRPDAPASPAGYVNTLVNDAAADATAQDTQNGTAIVLGDFGRIIVGFNDSGSYLGGFQSFTGWSRSDDGGNSFTDQGRPPTSASGDAGYPLLVRSSPTGTIFLSSLSFNSNLIQIFRSTDNGTTFQAPVNGTPGFTTASNDREWIAVDNFAGSSAGYVYLVWRNFGTPNEGIVFTRSTDDGLTWGPSTGTLLAAPSTYNVQGPVVTVGTDHSIYVFWHHQAAVGTASTIRMRRSTDGGTTWGSPVTVASLRSRGTNGDLGLGFRSNAFPRAAVNPVSGDLYVVYPDSAGNGTDRCNIYITSSTNNGSTWSLPALVNDDFSPYDQWQPTLAVRPDGSGLSVAWYDRKSDPSNTLIERWARNASLSAGTVSFGPSFKVSNVPFPAVYGVDPVVNSTFMGDLDQMAADNDYYYTTWGDNRDASIAVPSRKNANVRFAKYPSGAILDVSSYEVSGGDGDGIIEVNECNNLTVSVRNNGATAVTGVTAELTSLTPSVKVFNSIQSYSDIGPGSIVINSTPFLLSVPRSFPGGTPIKMRLSLSFAGGSLTSDFDVVTGEYEFTTASSVPMVNGTTDIGNHYDDAVTPVFLPFPVKIYNEQYSVAYASSNGNLQFESSSPALLNGCAANPSVRTAIMPHFDDLVMSGSGNGIFTLVEGVSPNRIFDIEWKGYLYSGGTGATVNFVLRFFEEFPNQFQIIYGTVTNGGSSATVGIQYGTGYFSHFSCNTATLTSGLSITGRLSPGGEGTGTCLPPSLTVTPPTLTLTLPQNGSGGMALKLSNTAPLGNDVLAYSAGDYSGTLVLSKGQTLPLEIRRQMGVFSDKDLKEEYDAKPLPLLGSSNTAGKVKLSPYETARGERDVVPVSMNRGTAATSASVPYVETFESGSYSLWFNEGTSTTIGIGGDTPAEGSRYFTDTSTYLGHLTSLRQDWSGGITPSSIEFYVRPQSPAGTPHAYVVLTTGAPGNTEVIWFYASETGHLYVNGDLPSGDTSVAWTPATWYNVEYRNINWTSKTFDYYVDGTLIKAGVGFRNPGSVSNIDRVHIYNYWPGAVASWDGFRFGGQGRSPWLSESPTGGVISAGSTASLFVKVNATGLAPGSYTGTVVISSNDPVSGTITVPVSVTIIPPEPPTEFAIIADAGDASLHIADVTRNVVYGPYLQGSLGTVGGLLDPVITPDLRKALFSSFSPGQVFIVDITDLSTPTVLDTVILDGGLTAEDLALTADGKFGIVTGGSGNNRVTSFDVSTGAVVTSLDITPRFGVAVDIGKDGTVLLVSYLDSSVHVARIDLLTGILTDMSTRLTAGAGAINVAISPDGKTALVANYTRSSITTIQIAAPGVAGVTGTINSLKSPQGIAFSPDGQFAYVLQTGTSPDSVAEIRITGPGTATSTGRTIQLLDNAYAAYFGVDAIAISSTGLKALASHGGPVLLPMGPISIVDINAGNVPFGLMTSRLATGVAIGGTAGPGSVQTSSSDLPTKFAVDQNYPNPFNPTTEIRYALPTEAYVWITVFNTLGQAVKTLVAEHQKAGYYHVTWESDNNAGRTVGSGVYFYKVTAGPFSSTRKMLLLK